MSDEPAAYPLAWPVRIPRHKGTRIRASFRKETTIFSTAPGGTYTSKRHLTVSDAIERLQGELRRLGAARFVCSTNLKVRRDGLAYSETMQPADPGVAVYFRLKDRPYCLPCDRWDRVADNIAAIASHVSALRGIERWGVGTVEQAFTGYLALPSPDDVDWRAEFPNVATLDEVESLYRERAKALHPDADGSHEAMVRLNRARDAARTELSA